MRAVILGVGEVGIHLARRLGHAGMEVVLVDRDSAAVAVAEESVDALTMVGDVAHYGVQDRAGVSRADLVLAVTGSDETNLAAAALAAQLGARRTMARADAAGFYRTKMAVESGTLGISHLLCASRLLDRELRRLIRSCHADTVIDVASYSVRALVMTITDDSPVLGQTSGDIRATGADQIRAIIRDGILRHLGEVGRLEAGDQLLLAGPPTEVAIAQHHLQQSYRKRRAVLIGGGDVGSQLAATLCKTERRVEIIERDADRCRALAETLPEANVVHGDGTSIALLRDQQIQSADYVLAVTRSDEANLMVSLLATDLGVKHTFAIVHRHGYADVYTHLGVHGTAGPHDVIANTVMRLLPDSGVLSRHRLPDCSHELVEYQLEELQRSGRVVDDLALPPGCLLLAMSREHRYLSPSAGTELQSGDHLVIAEPIHARKEVAKRVERISKRTR